ncbi:MAG: hypothetical protein ACK5AZ_13160 [Bryobacteraceae bacterium]
MASRARTRRRDLLAYLKETQTAYLSETESERLRELFAPISDRTFRQALRDSGIPLAPLVEGVRQDTLDHLECTLLALSREYQAAVERLGSARAQLCRQSVISAKQHARWALRSPKLTPEGRALREEALLYY